MQQTISTRDATLLRDKLHENIARITWPLRSSLTQVQLCLFVVLLIELIPFIVLVVGWGSENPYAIRPATLLKQAAVPIVPSNKSVYYLDRFDLGAGEMVCARTGKDRSGLCFIEAYGGSPLVCEHEGRWYLEGVLVEADCRNALYASVRWHFDWINSVMKYN